MKFILFSDNSTLRRKVLTIFSEKERDIVTVQDPDILFSSVSQLYHIVILIDVKFQHFPAFRIAKELKEKFYDRNIKLFFLMPEIKAEYVEKVCKMWSVDGVITYNELEPCINMLMQRFPQAKTGNFKEKPFLKLLMELKRREFKGTLIVNKGGQEKAVYFENGDPRYAITSRSEERIGGFLLREKRINEEDLSSLLEESKKRCKRFGEFLVEKNLITKDDLRQILEKQMEEIFESIFAWEDADYTLSHENIAIHEDILITRGLEELVYAGIMRYGNVNIPAKSYPELLVHPEEVRRKYPVNERALNLLKLMKGNESIELLSYKSDCTLKEIERLVYLLLEVGYLVLHPLPKKEEEDPKKVALGRITTTELPVDIRSAEKSEEVSEEMPEVQLPSPLIGEKIEASYKEEKAPLSVGRGESVVKEYKGIISRAKSSVLTNVVITIAAVVVSSVLVMLVMKHRNEEKRWKQEIDRSQKLINTDTVVALRNATGVLSDCLKKRYDLNLASILAFAYIRLYELTSNQEYLGKAKEIMESEGFKEKEDIDWRSINLLFSLIKGETSIAERISQGIKEPVTPISAYSLARYKMERFNDPDSVLKILQPFSKGESRALKLELGNALFFAGRIDELKAIVDELKQELPGHPDVIMLRGDISYLSGNYSEAETLYRLSLESRPGHLPTTIRLAKTHLALKKPDLVLNEIVPVIERTSIKTACGRDARFIYGGALKLLKKYNVAKEIFLELASYYPDDEDIRTEIDSINRATLKTVSLYESKPSGRAILKRAKRLYEQGRYEEAVKEFEKGLEKGDDEFLYWYALSLEAMDNSIAALLQLKKAEGKNPKNPLVHRELGKIYRERGNEEEATRHFKLYLQYIKK